jgi:hypothetical protein
MARQLTADERIQKAWVLIQKARDLPVLETGRYDLTYLAQVKGFLQEARDLVKFISYRPGASPGQKEEAGQILAEADRAQKEILRG